MRRLSEPYARRTLKVQANLDLAKAREAAI